MRSEKDWKMGDIEIKKIDEIEMGLDFNKWRIGDNDEKTKNWVLLKLQIE